MSIHDLTMDVWAHVACFLTQRERIDTFFALRRAMVLPTHRTAHETMLQFLELAARRDADTECVTPTVHDHVDRIVEMGYERELVASLFEAYCNDVGSVMEHLMNEEVIVDL